MNSLFFQYIVCLNWLSFFGFSFVLGLDSVSLYFILLTTFLTPICILSCWKNIVINCKSFFLLFLILELFLLFVFSVLDLLLFYIFFESVLIPMFLIIGIWGTRARKIRASYFFFLYTLIGSLIMLLGILFIFFETGTTNYFLLMTHIFTHEKQLILWFMFFLAFAVKIPIIPFHIWLPEAHVEAPTSGSVILAGVLLKLGIYGLVRFSFILFPHGTLYFTPLVYVISLVSILYSSLTTLRQLDLKRIVAYSSVAHMNFCLLGLFSNTLSGVVGALFLSVSHGFVASALFLCIGILYDRHHTRLIKYYSGLTTVMPVFSVVFLVFSLSNMGLPGTSSFIGEVLILIGSFDQNHLVSILGTGCILLGSLYSIWLYNRICFGNLKIQFNSVYFDISRREFFMLLPLILSVLFLGFFPNVITNTLLTASYFLWI
jgi:proton-translocating NADH-quinone oxidoreductase chain M